MLRTVIHAADILTFVFQGHTITKQTKQLLQRGLKTCCVQPYGSKGPNSRAAGPKYNSDYSIKALIPH